MQRWGTFLFHTIKESKPFFLPFILIGGPNDTKKNKPFFFQADIYLLEKLLGQEMTLYKHWTGQWLRDNRPNMANLLSKDKEILEAWYISYFLMAVIKHHLQDNL